MNFKNWKDIAELAGIVAIVASLVFVGLQMKQSQELAFADSVLAMSANSIEAGSLQTEHIAVWIKGNVGEELDATDREIYKILFNNRLNLGFYNWIALERIGTQYEGVASQGLARFLYENPGALSMWNLQNQRSDNLRVRTDGTFPAFAAEVEADLKLLKTKQNR